MVVEKQGGKAWKTPRQGAVPDAELLNPVSDSVWVRGLDPFKGITKRKTSIALDYCEYFFITPLSVIDGDVTDLDTTFSNRVPPAKF